MLTLGGDVHGQGRGGKSEGGECGQAGLHLPPAAQVPPPPAPQPAPLLAPLAVPAAMLLHQPQIHRPGESPVTQCYYHPGMFKG